MKLKASFFICALFISSFLLGQDPPPPDGLVGNELRTWLRDNWYTPFHSSVGYNSARQNMYSDIDNNNGDVFCVYSGFNQPSAFTTFLDPINTEHTVPQSFFNSDEPMRSDVHHLFPTHQDVNSARGSLPFGESEDTGTDNWYIGDDSDVFILSFIPSSDIDSYSERDVNVLFEPKENHKGDVARAVFYFYTMYPSIGVISDVADPAELHAWHLEDLPDSKEILRNEKIKDLQGNYNPYINHPELVSPAFGFPSNVEELNLDIDISIFPNPSNALVNIDVDAILLYVNVYDLLGNLAFTSRNKSFDLSSLNSGIYTFEIHLEKGVLREKFILE